MWWDDILAFERAQHLAALRKAWDDAAKEVDYWRAANVARATPEQLVLIDRALRDANNRYWKAHTAYHAACKETPS